MEASVRFHHGVHNQCGSVGGVAFHPREELHLCQRFCGAGGSGGERGSAESLGISSMDTHHCSGKQLLYFNLKVVVF